MNIEFYGNCDLVVDSFVLLLRSIKRMLCFFESFYLYFFCCVRFGAKKFIEMNKRSLL